MSAPSINALLKALYTALSGDSGLMAVITGVYDHVPENAAYPYVTIGEGSGRDWSASGGFDGADMEPVLRIYSRSAGRKECAAIMTIIHSLLHRSTYTVEGHALVQSRLTGSDIRLQPDGERYVGTMRMRVLLEETA